MEITCSDIELTIQNETQNIQFVKHRCSEIKNALIRLKKIIAKVARKRYISRRNLSGEMSGSCFELAGKTARGLFGTLFS